MKKSPSPKLPAIPTLPEAPLPAQNPAQAVQALATPAPDKVSKVYQHWADGDAAMGTGAEWNNNILSANKSDYFEGEVVPNMFFYQASNKTPLVTGQSYSFNVTYNHYQGNTNAGGYAYMTTYNIDRSPGTLTGATPSLDTVAPANNGGGMQGDFYSVNANVTGVSAVTYTNKGGSIDAQVTITFTYTGPTTSSGGAEIYFGLMVATPGMVTGPGADPTLGAHAWTGGSLQTTVDIGGSGATSIQLAPSAIIAGEIGGMKYEDVNGDGTRDADGIDNIAGNADDEAGLSGWTIFLDTNNNGSLDAGERSTVTGAGGLYVFSVTPDADPSDPDNDAYIVREVMQAGWIRTSTNPGPITIDAQHPTKYGVDFGNQRDLPALNIIKEATVPGGTADQAGEVISYTIAVQNTGNQKLTGVTVTDPFISNLQLVADGASSDGELDVGETWHYTASHTVLQAEIDAGGNIVNIATADSDQTGPDTDGASVPVQQKPAMTIDKVASVPGGTADTVDEIIRYTITVTNSGNQTLTGVTVTDPFVSDLQLVIDDASSDGQLGVDEVWYYTASHTVTQQDIDDDGTIDNTATADSSQTDPVSDSASVPVEQRPALTIDKEASVPGGTADRAGEVISYTMFVKNTGTQTLTGISVTDPFVSDLQLVVDGSSSDGELDVGETWKYTASHTVLQSEIDAGGNIVNIATADSEQSAPATDDASVPVEQKPALLIDKAIAGITGGNGNSSADAPGDVLNYTVTVYNAGNQTLTNVSVEDPFTGLQTSGLPLVPGESYTYFTNYTLTQNDLDTYGVSPGFIPNTAYATSNQTPQVSDSEIIPVLVRRLMSVDKSVIKIDGGNGNSVADFAGDVLHYTVTLKNLGTVTLTNVETTDPLTGLTASGLTLAPNESHVYETTYTLKQSDLDTNGNGTGYIINTAEIVSDQMPTPISDSETVPLLRIIAMGFNKSALAVSGGNDNLLADYAGDILNYRFVVSNPGTVTLTNVRVVDPLTGLDSLVGDVLPGTSATLFSSYVLKQSDLDGEGTGGTGSLNNTATVTADGGLADTDGESVPLVFDPRVDLTKYVSVDNGATWDDANIPPGPTLSASSGFNPLYKFVVANVGNITLPGVEVADNKYDLNGADPGSTHLFGTLAPGETAEWIFTGATFALGPQSDIASATVVGLALTTDVDNAYYTGV